MTKQLRSISLIGKDQKQREEEVVKFFASKKLTPDQIENWYQAKQRMLNDKSPKDLVEEGKGQWLISLLIDGDLREADEV